jgi:hypothetical protein
MQSLLRWSIENSTPQDGSQATASTGSSPASNQKLDPGIIDMILGRPDAELMKEDVAVATNTRKSEDERLNALDHLEMVSVLRVMTTYFGMVMTDGVLVGLDSLFNRSIMRTVRLI